MRGGRSSFAIAFVRDEAGVLTFLSLIFFVMLMAVGGLSIDLGRLYGERGQMQAYVDNAALSAASQLDYQTGALDRGVRAAMGETVNDTTIGPLITGSESFSNTPGNMEIQSVAFLDSLDSSWVPPDAMPYGTDHVLCTYESGAFTCPGGTTEADAENTAQFVEVTAAPRTVSYLLLPLVDFIGRLFGASSTVSSQLLALQAAAGFKQEVCDINPLMICNPDEPSDNTNTLLPFTPTVGEQILMKASGTGAAWEPGDFGLLQPSTDAGGSCKGNTRGAGFITCVLGLVDPLIQCTKTSITVKPGQAESTSNGFNARFDLYLGSGNKMQGDQLFAPAADVTKGIVGQGNAKCPNNYNPAPSGAFTVPFPRDPGILAGTTRFGNNCWYAYLGQPVPPTCDAGQVWPPSGQSPYWNTNHPGVAYPVATLGTTPTRFDVYKYENDNNLIPNKSKTGGENGNATCTTPPVAFSDSGRDRRTLTMAVVNCYATGLHGNTNNTGSYNVPAVAYVNMFLTEPVGLVENSSGKVTGFSNSVNNLYGEIASIVKPGDDTGVLHVNPVLYR